MFVSRAVEAAARHHGRAEWMRHPFQLRHHTSGLANHDLACLLPGAAVELKVLRHRPDGAQEVLGALPTVGLGDDAAVVTDPPLCRLRTRSPGCTGRRYCLDRLRGATSFVLRH